MSPVRPDQIRVPKALDIPSAAPDFKLSSADKFDEHSSIAQFALFCTFKDSHPNDAGVLHRKS